MQPELNTCMTLPVKSDPSTKSVPTNGKPANVASNVQKPKEVEVSECLEALIGCAIIAKYSKKTKERFDHIAPVDIVHVINDIRCNRTRITKNGGDGTVSREVGPSEDRSRISLSLKIASIDALLSLSKEEKQLATQLSYVCTYLNSGSMEKKLLNKWKKDIYVQSEASDKRAGDLLLRGSTILFT